MLTMTINAQSRWAWAMTGSGHFLKESVELLRNLSNVDLYLSRAAVEVLRMYKIDATVNEGGNVFLDKTASAAPIGAFYYGAYHTVVVSPATSNAVAKFVYGISDDLVTNVFAHAGKTRVHTIVFACDTAPELVTLAPKGPVTVYPRPVDLANRDALGRFEGVHVVDSAEGLAKAIALRKVELEL